MVKFSLKKEKLLSFKKKKKYLGTFSWNLKKTVAIFLISTLEFFNMEASCKVNKYWHLGQKMLYLGIFWLELERSIVIFEINAIKFVWLQSLVQNKNY